MKMKYCPECGSIQLQSFEETLKCKKCSFVGEMKEDSIDVINSIAARKKSPLPETSVFNPVSQQEIQKPNESVFSKSSFQNCVSNTNYQKNSFQSVTLKKEEIPLKERLKKFENDDTEIL